MTIIYGHYTLQGTVDEVLEFIRKTTPTFASGSLSVTNDDETNEVVRKLFGVENKNL